MTDAEAIAGADILPAGHQPLGGVGAGERAQRHEDAGRRLAAEQQEGREQAGQQQADQHGQRQHRPELAELEVAADQGDDVARDAEEQRLAEAHDAREAPAQIEADGEQRQDQHVGGERDEVGPLAEGKGNDQRHEQRRSLDPGQDATERTRPFRLPSGQRGAGFA